MIADILAGAGSEEFGISEADAGSEELTIAEASLEFGMSEALLRQELRSGRLERIPHRSRVWVRRGDVAILAASPRLNVARFGPPPARWPPLQPRSKQSHQKPSGEQVLRLVEKLGEASVNQVHQGLIEGGAQHTRYDEAGTVLRDLAKAGKLATEREGHRLLYHLWTEADNMPIPTPEPVAVTSTPRPRRTLPMRPDTPLTPLEETVLAAMRKPGNANLDQLYRSLARPVGASYPAFVLAVRGLVQKGQVIRVQEHGRYLYEVGE